MGGNTGLEPVVTQEFTPKGAREMGDFTSAHTNEIMGIVLDDRVLSAPNIESTITDEGQISGGFANLKEATELANMLNAGALPVPLSVVQVESVEASLGKGAVMQSLKAGIAGLVLVLIFMAFWYKIPGLLADVALIIYALFTFAIYKGGLQVFGLEPVTMTLPGIAGFILSIGMAVDANILIFERMKEELANGKTPRAAIDAGFNRAFPAIRDSNICTIITCIVLLSLGTASVKGFALTLLIGVVVSLFSAITVTRTLLFLLVEAGHITNPAQLGYRPRPAGVPEKHLNIIGRRKFFYGLSGLIIVPGLIFYFMGGLQKSIEFTGGSQIEVKYDHRVTQEQVLAAARAGGIKDPLVQMAEGDTIAIVSTPDRSTEKANDGENMVQYQLEQALGPNGKIGQSFTLNSFDKVEGIISKELTARAIQAVIVASICIVLYLALVFSIGGFVAGLRLGTSAIAALLHDVLVLLGVFSIAGKLFGWKIDSLFVTAMLTVIGFSVHDTVVIFDRVRENLRHRIKGENFEQLVNRSIQQTLNRSLRTSGTVLMTLLALLIFGGHTTFQLNFALFVGILSGTYSSIFNAAAILVDWENWLAKRRGTGAAIDMEAASAIAATRPASVNGGSTRPIVTAPRPTPMETGSGSVSTSKAGVGISQTKAKKKKPARRF
jgi:SecD/SecF fusion protein